jgi:hypothetical protein
MASTSCSASATAASSSWRVAGLSARRSAAVAPAIASVRARRARPVAFTGASPRHPSHVSRANLRPIAISFLTSNRRLSWQRFSRCHSIAGVTPKQPASSWRVHICVCVVGGGGGGSGVCQAPTKRLAHRHTPPATHKYVLPFESNNFAVRWAQNPSWWQAHSTQVSSVSHPITTVSPVPCTWNTLSAILRPDP